MRAHQFDVTVFKAEFEAFSVAYDKTINPDAFPFECARKDNFEKYIRAKIGLFVRELDRLLDLPRPKQVNTTSLTEKQQNHELYVVRMERYFLATEALEDMEHCIAEFLSLKSIKDIDLTKLNWSRDKLREWDDALNELNKIVVFTYSEAGSIETEIRDYNTGSLVNYYKEKINDIKFSILNDIRGPKCLPDRDNPHASKD